MAEDENPATDGGLNEAMEALAQGMLWLDEHQVIRKHNRAFRRFLDIDGEDRFVGRPCRELLQFLLARGDYAGTPDDEQALADRMVALQRGEPASVERVRPDGRVLRISASRLPSGGSVYNLLDVTRERQALESVRRKARATMLAMANFAEHRDSDTGIHVLRVARLSRQIARHLQRTGAFAGQVDEAFVECIGTASILHDVGKLSTPDQVLRKAGALSAGERDTMQLHAAVGARLLRQARLVMGDNAYLDMGADIALTHHEWFNGGGYPAGLAGAAIPLAGRICAVADVFDALTSRRPYKEPWTVAQAVSLIRSQSGAQFDPGVVEAFVAAIRERETVSVVQWAEAMSIGNPHIDEQHKILIDTINQLASADRQNDRTLVGMIIDELLGYAAFHFHYEEDFLAAAGYPDLERHRRIHQSFVQWISGVRDEFIGHQRPQLGDRILHFLRDWLRDHILGEDLQVRRYTDGDVPSAVSAALANP